jgi:hypothetical protein
MKISVWQQWASNHSASFTVVGKFKSAEVAAKAADTLRSILLTIAEWYKRPENANLRKQWEEGEQLPPSPPEVEFARQYGVEWNEYSVDWVDWRRSPESVDQAVVLLDNWMFVSSMNETWLGARPFDALTTSLGGQATVTGEAGDSEVSVNITCTVANPSTMDAMYEELTAYFKNPIMSRVPWAGTSSSRIRLSTGEEMDVLPGEQAEAEDWFRKLQNAANEARWGWRQQPDVETLINAIPYISNPQQRQANMEELNQRMQEIPEAQTLQQVMQSNDPAIKRRVMLALHGALAGFGTGALKGHVKRDGQLLYLKNITFYRIGASLPDLLRYLKQKDTQDIRCKLSIRRLSFGEVGQE